jgi:hypothetical protein
MSDINEQREALQVLGNFEIAGPDDDGLLWLVLHGDGTTGKAMFNLGACSDRLAGQVALLLEQDRRAALASRQQPAEFALIVEALEQSEPKVRWWMQARHDRALAAARALLASSPAQPQAEQVKRHPAVSPDTLVALMALRRAGKHEIADELEATATQPPAQDSRQEVPQGWKLVPVEPTEAMIDAAIERGAAGDYNEGIWAAMLAAAPSQPPAPAAQAELQERARTLAEDWHEGVSTSEQYDWCCKAAGALLALSKQPAPAAREPQLQPMSEWRAEKMAREWLANQETDIEDLIREVENFHGITGEAS